MEIPLFLLLIFFSSFSVPTCSLGNLALNPTDFLPPAAGVWQLQNYLQCFCGTHIRHLQTHVFDQQFVQPTFGLGGKRETTFSQPAGSTRRPEQMQRQLPLLPFHSPDRLVGVMLSTQSMHDSRLAIWLQPGSHRSGRLETQMQQPDGRICNQVFEHPQRLPPTDSTNGDHRLSTSITGFDPLLGHVYPAWSNEAQPHVVRLAPGDLFFFHPLLAHRLLFEENRPPPPRQSTPLVNILALQLWFGASEILPIRRNFASADSSLIFETRTIDGNKTTHPKFFQRSANADGSIDDNVSGSDASVDGQLATAEGDVIAVECLLASIAWKSLFWRQPGRIRFGKFSWRSTFCEYFMSFFEAWILWAAFLLSGHCTYFEAVFLPETFFNNWFVSFGRGGWRLTVCRNDFLHKLSSSISFVLLIWSFFPFSDKWKNFPISDLLKTTFAAFFCFEKKGRSVFEYGFLF